MPAHPLNAMRGIGRGLTLGRLFGAPIVIAWSWFLAAIVLVLVVAYWITAIRPDLDSVRWVLAGSFLIILFGSVFLHELAHAVVGRFYGYRVSAIELNVWGGFTRFEPGIGTERPGVAKRSFVISVVGPAANLVLALLAWVVGLGVDSQSILGLIVQSIVLANVVLGVMNLLPGIPLDGGWAVQALVWKISGNPFNATIWAAWGGRVVALGFTTYGLLWPPLNGRHSDAFTLAWTLALAVVLWFSASDSIDQAKQARRVETYNVSAVVQPAISAAWDTPLASVVDYDAAVESRPLIVVLDAKDLPFGFLDRDAAKLHAGSGNAEATVGDVARPLRPWIGVPAGISAPHLLESLIHRPKAEMCLVMRDQRLTGVIDLQELYGELLKH